VVRVREGDTLRLRLINASNARYYRLQSEDHPMHLIATDGGLIEKPVALEELLLAPGERAEVLVQLEREGFFGLKNLPYDRGTHQMGGMMGHDANGQAETLLRVMAPPNPKPSALPGGLMPVEQLEVARATVTRRITMTEHVMPLGFFFNDKGFDHRVDIRGLLGTIEVWELENKAGMDHPFHLHSYPFQVLERNGRSEPFRAWKDMVNLRRNGRVKLGVPLRDFTGLTVYQRHIVEHEDRGMMGTLEVRS
jgi:FtsP/CotA-like multicopper oxidase with cupredoxin domain